MSKSRDRRRRQDRRDRNDPGTVTIRPDFAAFNEAMKRVAVDGGWPEIPSSYLAYIEGWFRNRLAGIQPGRHLLAIPRRDRYGHLAALLAGIDR